ncbi:Na(+)/H(+) antiporter [Dissulfuribacter thermophilus]|uniref:Na(+)/H(+) antiporter n=2 Tax=Dissulfuribacter thermophilus TaxID=1156395 RepID=A0A1B9F5I1_9BACT|nr:Na(+)/H(+) antiporter [Dissulfuribacter thermophilus]
MDISLLATAGIMILAAYIGGRLANLIGLPRISGYLFAGILLGENLANLVPKHAVAVEFSWITSVALCIIGYGIGGSLEFKRLARLGSTIFWITFFQAIGALVFSTIAIYVALRLFGPSEMLMTNTIISMSLTVGAICVATAPSSVLAVISETGARGVYTDILLGVVALDDGVTLLIFAAVMALIQGILRPEGLNLHTLLVPLWEIVGSISIGCLFAFLMSKLLTGIYEEGAILKVILGALILIAGLCPHIHCSPILASMSVGCFIVNYEKRHNLFFQSTDPIENAVFGLFFALAGAHMDFRVLSSFWHLSLVILVFRFLGKQFGVFLGSSVSKTDERVKKYLGIGLFPQAGVSIGLILVGAQYFDRWIGELLINFVIGSVIFNEIISPPLLKWCLTKAGETTR